jgi:dTDP-4-dehydrorhamnose reductase
VDAAENFPDAAMAINAAAPGVLAAEAARLGAAMVQFSTDYVFDGTAGRPLREDDPPNPLGAYGASKRAGEDAVRAALADHLILRTAWLYARPGRNFVTTIARLARRESELRVVDDQVGSPTWAADLARDTATILARSLSAGGDRLGGLAGTYHLAGSGATSRYGFARAILGELARHAPGAPLARLVPVSTRDRPDRARRPAYSALDTGLARRIFGLEAAPWERRLAAFFVASGPDTEF